MQCVLVILLLFTVDGKCVCWVYTAENVRERGNLAGMGDGDKLVLPCRIYLFIFFYLLV